MQPDRAKLEDLLDRACQAVAVLYEAAEREANRRDDGLDYQERPIADLAIAEATVFLLRAQLAKGDTDA